jgi:hypothetical protein
MPTSHSTPPSLDWRKRLERAAVNPTSETTNGVLASDFLAELLDKKSIGRVYRTPKSKEQALFNWMLVLKEAKPYVEGYRAEELLADDARRAEFLKRLAGIGAQQTPHRSVERKGLEFESPPGSPRHTSIEGFTLANLQRSATAQHLRRTSNLSEILPKTQTHANSMAEGASSHKRTSHLPFELPTPYPLPQNSRTATPIKTANSPLLQTSPAPSPFIKQTSKLAHERPPLPKPTEPFQKQEETLALQRSAEKPRAPPSQSAYERPVPESIQEGLLEWVESLDMVKRGALTPSLLVSFSRTGVFLCDLINRLEGRQEALKGVQRNPKNNTAALANVSKALEFLKSFPKMNSRYLWAGPKLIEGNENVIWGLIEDIRALYSGKDHSKSPIAAPKTTAARPPTAKPTRAPTAIPTRAPTAVPKVHDLALPHSFLQAKSISLRSYASSARSRSPMTRAASVRVPYKAPENVSIPEIQVTEEMMLQVEEWLSALGLDYLLGFEVSSVTEDPFKNGALLCEIVSVLEKTQVRLNAAPRSERAVRENMEQALGVLRDKRPGVPYGLLLAGERLASGDTDLMWGLLWSLMNAYPSAGVSHSSELPYGAVATKRLEASLLSWLHSLQILSRLPTSLQEVLPQIKNGSLVCALVNLLVLGNTRGRQSGSYAQLEYVENPKTVVSCQQNLHKALVVLQKVPRMSQKWTWKEKELLAGDSASVLGLLEDLHRMADGLPARKRGASYHSDGPYLGLCFEKTSDSHITPGTPSWKGQTMETPLSFKAESPSATFRVNRTDSASTSIPSQMPRVFERGMTEAVEAHELAQWIIELGVTSNPLNLQGSTLEGFGDGLLLCKILEAVSRTPISNLQLHPRTKAACLQNTRKGLQFLQQIPRFPRDLLLIENELISGDGPVIRALLKEIQHRCKTSSARGSVATSYREGRGRNVTYEQ